MEMNSMESEIKIALLVVYNHRYDRNIDVIENLYKDKFSFIFHLMPFYDGDRENVIAVYDTSLKFQNYIAQAYNSLKIRYLTGGRVNFTHYFIVADDMLLNPEITENNLFEKMGLSGSACFITDLRELRLLKRCVYPLFYKVKKKGVEIENILPKYDDAVKCFARHFLSTEPVRFSLALKFMFRELFDGIKNLSVSRLAKFAKIFIFILRGRRLAYPLLWAYSDILLITKDVMPKFCTYCGAFAASDLAVEFAVPTALVLSADKITTEKTAGKHSIANDYQKIKEIERKYNFDVTKLLENFPENASFIHPIKFSKWK